MERLAYGLFIRRANVTERINRYADVLRGIERDVDLADDDSPLQLRPDEKQGIIKALDGPIYLQTARVVRTLLERLNWLLFDSDPIYSRMSVTVEHVLPQKPETKSEWMEWFPDEGVRASWTHRLANLVLLSSRKNSAASNYEFGRKKDEYFRRGKVASYPLTVQVLSETEWTPDMLEGRQHTLMGRLQSEWRLD